MAFCNMCGAELDVNGVCPNCSMGAVPNAAPYMPAAAPYANVQYVNVVKQGGFFDELSPKWLNWFKVFIIVMFFLNVIGGFVLSCIMMGEEIGFLSLMAYDDDLLFLDFIFTNLIAWIVALIDLIPGMLILNYLRNVQIIREKVEYMAQK